MTKYLKTQMQAPRQMGNFALKHMEHGGMNPMLEAHIQSTFNVKPAKQTPINMPSVAPSAPVGSPWTQMSRGKAK